MNSKYGMYSIPTTRANAENVLEGILKLRLGISDRIIDRSATVVSRVCSSAGVCGTGVVGGIR